MRGDGIGQLSEFVLMLSGLLLFIMMMHVSADVALTCILNKPLSGTLEIVSAY